MSTVIWLSLLTAAVIRILFILEMIVSRLEGRS